MCVRVMDNLNRIIPVLLFGMIVILAAACSDDTSPVDQGPDFATDIGFDQKAAPDKLAVDQMGPGPDALNLDAPNLDAPYVDILLPDTLPAPDGPPVSDAGQVPCTGGFCGFVFNRVKIPTDSTTSEKYALLFNGKKYNSLGGIMALIVSQAPTMTLQLTLDEATCAGKGLHLLRLKTKSLVKDPSITGQIWPSTASCCSASSCFSKASKQCSPAANAACFTGSSSLTPTKGYTSPQLSGGIAAGKLTLGPGKAMLYFPLAGAPGSTPLLIALKGASIRGKLVGTGINNGVLSGAIDKTDLQKKVVPAIAAGINANYTDPKTDAKTKALLKTLFDTNKDGKITTVEVKNNGLIKTFLDGDVDVDGDGIKELSVGVGFTAVGAKVVAP